MIDSQADASILNLEKGSSRLSNDDNTMAIGHRLLVDANAYNILVAYNPTVSFLSKIRISSQETMYALVCS